MIILIIKSYLSVLLAIGFGSIFVFMLGVFFIFKNTEKKSRKKSIQNFSQVTVTTDFSSIAGEDIIATQLDLARAYIEADMQSLAKKILDSVVEQGNLAQQEEAQRLLRL